MNNKENNLFLFIKFSNLDILIHQISYNISFRGIPIQSSSKLNAARDGLRPVNLTEVRISPSRTSLSLSLPLQLQNFRHQALALSLSACSRRSSKEEFYGKPVTIADRELVEERADGILSESCYSNVAFLVVGDPFGATTHTDLVVRAKKEGIKVQVIHNASVMNAIGVCGLQLYRYGETVSIPFFTDDWRPDSFYEKIKRNRALELHTLCLLDIRVKEPSLESLARGRKIYEPPKYMTIATAIEQLLEVEQIKGDSVYGEDSACVGMARLGSEDQMIVAGTMRELLNIDFGAPLHCLVIVGKTHILEEEMLEFYSLKNQMPELKGDNTA